MGQERRFERASATSALPPEADIRLRRINRSNGGVTSVMVQGRSRSFRDRSFQNRINARFDNALAIGRTFVTQFDTQGTKSSFKGSAKTI
jgi:hypothetical protein